MNEIDKQPDEMENNNKTTPGSLGNCKRLSELPEPVAASSSAPRERLQSAPQKSPPQPLNINNNNNRRIPMSLNNKLMNKKLDQRLDILKKPRTTHQKSSVSSSSPSLNSNSKNCNKSINNKQIFQYGNYNRYYGYRMKSTNNDFKDIRIGAFEKYPEYFNNSSILDIGCNDGTLTIALAKQFQPSRIIGIDIDRNLIDAAKRTIEYDKKRNVITKTTNNNYNTNATSTTSTLEEATEQLQTTINNYKYPNNIEFKQSNYVLDNELLLEMDVEKQRFDTILCLSVIKWIHLNWGDFGVCQTFKRIYRQLKPGGRLILEYQQWKSYKKRRTLTENIRRNYDRIQMRPTGFIKYLLSADIGFQSYFTMIDFSNSDSNNGEGPTSPSQPLLDNPKHCNGHGFNRPIYVFVKSSTVDGGQQ